MCRRLARKNLDKKIRPPEVEKVVKKWVRQGSKMEKFMENRDLRVVVGGRKSCFFQKFPMVAKSHEMVGNDV